MRLARRDRMAMMRRDDRQHARHPVLWSAMVSAEGKYEPYVLNGKIRNISVSGVQVLVDKTIEPGCRVTLRIHRLGTFSGHVTWCADDRLGVAFDSASKAAVELVLARLCTPAEPHEEF